MAIDIFGNTLYIGDVVVYADKHMGEKTVGLFLYEVEEIIGENLAMGKLLSGEFAGDTFYLEDTNDRCTFIRNVYKTAELHQGMTLN